MLGSLSVTISRTTGDGSLLRDAVADWDLENVTPDSKIFNLIAILLLLLFKIVQFLPAVFDLHLATTGVNMSVRSLKKKK